MAVNRWAFIAVITAIGVVTSVGAERVALARKVVAPLPGGGMNLPYSVSDNAGNTWMFYQYGQFQQQGNMPVYSQGAMLQINNNHPQIRNNTARLDEKTGEILFENMQGPNGITLTRRILFNKEEGYVRYIDVVKNASNQEQTPSLMYTTSLNYGVQQASMLADPRKKEQNIAWVAQTHANGRCVVEMFAGKDAKIAPVINHQPGNSSINVGMNPTIPAGKEIALLHFHYTTNSLDAGSKFVLGMKESKILMGIPSQLRRLILNFRGGENFVGDYEILRGEILDVVELRTGDQLKGTLKDKSFKLQAFYGAVDVPVDNVIGLINAGEFRPRQLIITRDGEVFGGKLAQDKLTLELSSGQLTEIPLSQITRMGYRKRVGEPEEWTFDRPIVLMRSGDRIGVKTPEKVIPVVTRYGAISLKPQTVAAINFQAEEHGVHEVLLSDGSKFQGLVATDAFEMKLAGEGPEQLVRFPASSIRRLQLSGKVDDVIEDEHALMKLANEDQLVGTLTGTLKLDTAFNTITLNAGEIKRVAATPGGSPTDVQVVLWDDTSVSGQLQEQELAIQLNSGVTMNVPVVLVVEYQQPRPQPSPAVVNTIKRLLAELDSDDPRQRELAQEKLVRMGVIVVSTLRDLRATQSPEGQHGIDLVLKQLDKDTPKKPAAAAANPNQ